MGIINQMKSHKNEVKAKLPKVSLKELITSAMTFHPLFYSNSALHRARFDQKSGSNVMADVINSFNLTLINYLFQSHHFRSLEP